MGKEYKIKCTEGHISKYITNGEVKDDILCPQLVDNKPCKSVCEIINEGSELKGELKVPLPKDEMIIKFFDHYRNEVKQKIKFEIMWYVSTDNHVMIRKFDFDLNHAIRMGMNKDYNNLKKLNDEEKREIVDDYLIKCYEDMYNNNKIIEFMKVKFDNVKKEENYTLDHTKMFGYSGAILYDVLSIFDNKCSIFIPDHCFPGYAKSPDDKYIIMFAPRVGIPEDIDTFKRFEKETRVSFDEDDIW